MSASAGRALGVQPGSLGGSTCFLEVLVLKFSLDLDQCPVRGSVPGPRCPVMET